MENSRKIKLLKLWEILKRDTDEKNPISTNALIEKLSREGIEVDRKILYSDIDLLNQYGYEVLKERGRSNKYYVVDRSFDLPEVRLLMDAVQAAGFVTERKTDELLDKIAVLAGSKRGEVLKENIAKFSTVKSINESIYYSINTIVEAKDENKKIGFYYFDYGIKREKVFRKEKENKEKDRWYIVNPVATVFDNDQYYLFCYDDKYKNLVAYRIDRMDKVKMLEEEITPNPEVEKTSLAEHKRQMFGMYSGEVEQVTFEADKGLLDVVFDKFGNRVKIVPIDENRLRCTAKVQTGPMFIAWCNSFDTRIKVISPQGLVDRVKESLEKTLEQYKK
ncbi:MAG: WYL domain-containing transcriptional regulator [Clostridia bacterium]|nr:WYL domain-containing transcriptional regulator [Clostridia bacterium]